MLDLAPGCKIFHTAGIWVVICKLLDFIENPKSLLETAVVKHDLGSIDIADTSLDSTDPVPPIWCL